MSEEPVTKVRKRAQPAIEELINDAIEHYEHHEYDINVEIWGLNPDSRTMHEHQIPHHSEILTSFYSLTDAESVFREISDWMINSGYGYIPDKSRDLDEEWLREQYMIDLDRVAKATLDYSSELEFDIDAYNNAFYDIIGVYYESKWTFSILIPITGLYTENFICDIESMVTEVEELQYITRIESDINIGPLTDSEISGLYTYDRQLGWRTLGGQIPDHPDKVGLRSRIRFEVSVQNRENNRINKTIFPQIAVRAVEELRDHVLEALRLYGPSRGIIRAGPICRSEPDWLLYREDIEKVIIISIVDSEWTRSYSYSLNQEDIPNFVSFWKEHSPYLQSESIRPALDRFNRMYDKQGVEDDIIDAFVGFENTLLKGSSANYTFRLPGRATLLLQDLVDDTEQLYEFFEFLQHCRNNILHNNYTIEDVDTSNLPEITDDIRTDAGNIYEDELSNYTRLTLARVLIRYIELMEEHDLTVNDLNSNLIEKKMKLQLMNPSEQV